MQSFRNLAALLARSRGLLGLGLVVLALAGCARPEPLPLPQPLDIPYAEGRFWKVEGADIQTSYLLGTIHLSDPRVLDLPPVVETAFASSGTAAFEYDFGRDGEKVPDFDIDRYKLPDDTTLRSIIGNGPFGKLTSIMQGKGFWRPRNDLKPWAYWDYLGGKRGTFYISDDESDSSAPILDSWLEQRAYEEGKTVVGLETFEAGFKKYDSIPMDTQSSMLVSVLENYHRRREGASLVQAYLDGDLGLLAAVWEEGMSWYPPDVADLLSHRIIVNRNIIFVDVMLPLMQKETTFVAFGAGHLPGDQGVVNLLIERGYKLTLLH